MRSIGPPMRGESTVDDFERAVRADARTYARWQTSPGFWVTLSYRLRRLRKYGPGWTRALLPIDLLFGLLRWIVSDSKIPSSCDIGPGLCLPHADGIIINGMAVIGANVRIFQQVTIGEWKQEAPRIGDGCSLFGGAKVFGPITLGRNVRIGPNAVVSESVPDHCNVVVAPPVVSRRAVAANADGRT